MQPREELSAAEIDLSDPSFWKLPEEVIEGAFVTLRREQPVSFHNERAYPPLIPQGPGYWAVSRYHDIAAVTKDATTFCNSRGFTIYDWPPGFADFFSHMLMEDEPRHTRLRRIVSRAFTPRHIARLEESIKVAAREVVDSLIDRGEVEFVSEVAGRLPVRIICEMVGIPPEYYDYVYEESFWVIRGGDPAFLMGSDNFDVTFSRIIEAAMGIVGLLSEFGEDRRAHPKDDVLTELVHADVEGEALTEVELAQFFLLITVAGNETTRNAIAGGMEALCRYPDEMRKWRSDIGRYTPTAVQEILRWSTPIIHFRRTATVDTEVADQAIGAGEKVVLFYRAGNRDETVFEEPYRFAIDRPERPAHLAFGAPGIHYCLGAHLARLEIGSLFGELLSRTSHIEMIGEPGRPGGNFLHGLTELRCAVTPAADQAGVAVAGLNQ